MPKNPLKGTQLELPFDCDEFRSQTPTSIKFLLLRKGIDVAFVGLAIAANARFVRVRYLDNGTKQEADIPKNRILPLEQATVTFTADQAEIIHDAISRLELERDRLKAEIVAPARCWIETGKVQGREFRQAWWRSQFAIFDPKRSKGEKVKSRYIGEEGGPEHEEAKRQKYRRDRLQEIDRQLKMLGRWEDSQ